MVWKLQLCKAEEDIINICFTHILCKKVVACSNNFLYLRSNDFCNSLGWCFREVSTGLHITLNKGLLVSSLFMCIFRKCLTTRSRKSNLIYNSEEHSETILYKVISPYTYRAYIMVVLLIILLNVIVMFLMIYTSILYKILYEYYGWMVNKISVIPIPIQV